MRTLTAISFFMDAMSPRDHHVQLVDLYGHAILSSAPLYTMLCPPESSFPRMTILEKSVRVGATVLNVETLSRPRASSWCPLS